MSLQDRVRALREKRGWNQSRLAKASEVTRATISRIESGQTKEIKSESLKNLAIALGVTMDFLAGRTREHFPSDITFLLECHDKLSLHDQLNLINYADFLSQHRRV